ncbi:MAG: DUF6542 domain-containing protein [Actinomycetes bacterium]
MSTEPARPRPPRGATRRGGSGRVRPGLSWAALTIGELLVVLLASAIDIALSRRLGWGFDIGVVVAALLGSLVVRRRDRYSAVLLPSIVAALAVLGTELYRHGWSGTTRTLLVVASELALLAPAVYLGTVLAIVVVLLRRRGANRDEDREPTRDQDRGAPRSERSARSRRFDDGADGWRSDEPEAPEAPRTRT